MGVKRAIARRGFALLAVAGCASLNAFAPAAAEAHSRHSAASDPEVQLYSSPQPATIPGAHGIAVSAAAAQQLAALGPPTGPINALPGGSASASAARSGRREAHVASDPTAYEVVNTNSNKCLDVYRASMSSGANVDQWTCNGGDNQYWVLDTIGTIDGYPADYIINDNSGLCLDVYHAALDNGANVDQWTCNEKANQVWIDSEATDRIFTNDNSLKVLEVYKQSMADGANVDQWTYNEGLNQLWYIP